MDGAGDEGARRGSAAAHAASARARRESGIERCRFLYDPFVFYMTPFDFKKLVFFLFFFWTDGFSIR